MNSLLHILVTESFRSSVATRVILSLLTQGMLWVPFFLSIVREPPQWFFVFFLEKPPAHIQ